MYLETYDIVFLTETHTAITGTVNFTNFKLYEFPDKNCNPEYPRGGTCILIKPEIMSHVKHVSLLMTDFIEICFTNEMKLLNLYIPPIDSTYYNEQYIELLCTMFIESDENNSSLIAMGDLNARLGDLNSINKLYSYQDNVDKTTNENGRHIKEMLFTSSSAIPLNHMETAGKTFDGGYTFERNEKKSQIDWCLVNKELLTEIEQFTIERNAPDISDHKPITVGVIIDSEKSLETLFKAAMDLNSSGNNHSKIPKINKQNTNLSCVNNLLKIEIGKEDRTNMSSHAIAEFLVSSVRRFGRIAKLPFSQRNSEPDESECDRDDVRENRFNKLFARKECQKWRFVKDCGDSKQLWKAINYKGEIKNDEHEFLDVEDLAACCTKRSKIEISQTMYQDLNTDETNEELDKDIEAKEVQTVVDNLNTNSKTSDGIGACTVKAILPTIMCLLLTLYNLVFKGGFSAYPSCWLSLINAIPKKGLLQIPKCVRFITIMAIFEKIYQCIISNRLYAFLKIPFHQTAYQKLKGCNMHVMTIRLLKVLTTKTKKSLFIVFTDFEAAFDLVSRRLLFQKLIKLGISAVMLNALIAIYVSGKSVMQHNKEFSDYVMLLAGVKQGAPPSGLLYIGYTLGLIDIYDNSFNPEPLIKMYHLLMHADDIMLLATSRSLIIEKLKCLMKFCKDNFVKLQMSKCAGMCVNSENVEDHEPVEIDGLELKNTSCEVYLGSSITNSCKLIDDVNADMKKRNVNTIKYFAFLRNNANAPVDVKLKVLEACTSAILYNAETWANSKIDRLDVVHRRMLKAILGIGVTTCTEFPYIELGVPSIKTRIAMMQWEFWNKVIELDNDTPLKQVIATAEQYRLKEVKHYSDLVKTFRNKQEIEEQFFEKTRESIRKKADEGRSKYKTYLQINPNLETPTYYNDIYNYRQVSMIAKLRVSMHNLQVEMGRRSRTPRDLRLCQCEQSVEDELHFLTQCAFYNDIRLNHRVSGNTKLCAILNDKQYVEYIDLLYKHRSTLR